MTKSISCSTRPSSGRLEVRARAPPGQDPLPRRARVLRPAQRPAHAGLPVLAVRDRRPGLDADDARLHRLPDVDVRVPDHEHVLARDRLRRCGSPWTRAPGGRPARRAGVRAGRELVDDRRAGRRRRPGTRRRRPRPAGRRPRPSRPARRRAGPRRRCGRRGPPGRGRRGRRPNRRRSARRTGRRRRGRRTRVTTLPSSRKPRGSSGNTRCLPKRSSRVTVPASQRTTAPQKPVPGSSTTRPGSAGTSGTGLGFFHGGVRSGGVLAHRMTIEKRGPPSFTGSRHAETVASVSLGPYERRVHHRPVARYVQRVLAAEREEPVEGRLATASVPRRGPPGAHPTPRPGRRRRPPRAAGRRRRPGLRGVTGADGQQ